MRLLKKRDEADKFMKTDKGKALSILSFKRDDWNESDIWGILNAVSLCGSTKWKGYKMGDAVQKHL